MNLEGQTEGSAHYHTVLSPGVGPRKKMEGMGGRKGKRVGPKNCARQRDARAPNKRKKSNGQNTALRGDRESGKALYEFRTASPQSDFFGTQSKR